jgi:hypothetical protein
MSKVKTIYSDSFQAYEKNIKYKNELIDKSKTSTLSEEEKRFVKFAEHLEDLFYVSGLMAGYIQCFIENNLKINSYKASNKSITSFNKGRGFTYPLKLDYETFCKMNRGLVSVDLNGTLYIRHSATKRDIFSTLVEETLERYENKQDLELPNEFLKETVHNWDMWHNS